MAKGGAKKAAAAAARAAANRMLADNRQARHQYEILETLETGIELVGTEVKSIRNGKANLRDGFCLIRNGELQLHNVHISPHTHAGSYFNHDPLRTRKLLAHRREIDKLSGGAIGVRSTSGCAGIGPRTRESLLSGWVNISGQKTMPKATSTIVPTRRCLSIDSK